MVRLPVAVLPGGIGQRRVGREHERADACPRFTTQVPVHAPATVAVTAAPTLLIVLDANDALVLSVTT